MNMKLILSILITIIIFSLLGLTSSSESKEEVYVTEGWNLVYGFTGPESIIGGDIAKEDIKAVYILAQPNKEYQMVYPDMDYKEQSGIDESYYEMTAQWVYSSKRGNIIYDAQEPFPIELMDEFLITGGWNMLGLTKEIIFDESGRERTLSDIAGDCNIEKVVVWVNGGWVEINAKEEFESTIKNNGLFLKVKDDCHLGLTENTQEPPQIP